ncbi:protein NEGATIVE REGULATOR OF RESISTANCE-like [Zingiber officinale]|nr:protein NEGATIVE REGULATOR OF RESISTANCE-like [Zingiber officinale]
MGMDPNPRKRESDGTAAEEERRTRRRVDEEPTDEEVEEFFAILRRIREAARHLGGARAGAADHGVARSKGRADGGAPPRWQPAFVPEDFEHPGAAESSGDRRERAEKDEGAGKWRTMSPGGERCFDLNEKPADT